MGGRVDCAREQTVPRASWCPAGVMYSGHFLQNNVRISQQELFDSDGLKQASLTYKAKFSSPCIVPLILDLDHTGRHASLATPKRIGVS
jgi:hypothetical protein